MRDHVLVVGAVLLDLIGESNVIQKEMVNKKGAVTISVGGAAFNVAANLAAKDVNVSLLTCLKSGSPTTHLIKSAIASSKINQNHVMMFKDIGEPAYVALFSDKKFISGITCSPIESLNLFSGNTLRNAVWNSSLVAVDTNLATEQIQGIADLCNDYNKPLVVSVVSDAKVNHILEKKFSTKFFFVSMNASESDVAGFSIKEEMNGDSIKRFCKSLNTKQVIISDADYGYYLLNENGEIMHFSAPDNLHIVSPLGAGDALFSAACISLLNKQGLSSPASVQGTRDLIASVLTKKESNIGFPGFYHDINPIPREKWPLITIFFTILSVLFMLIGTFSNGITPIWFAVCLFGSCISAGATGALIRRVIIGKQEDTNNISDIGLISIGMIAGLVSGLLSALPHLSVDGVANNLRSSVQGLNLLIILTFIVSVSAGIGFEAVLSNIKKPKIGNIKENSSQP